MPEPETIWIIGASDGIGAAMAREWAERGARLILSARSVERLEELAASLGAEHQVVRMDIADRDSVNEAANKIADFGAVDRVVHLAAIYDPGKVSELDPARASHIVSINLTGSFNVAQVAPSVLKRGGQLALCGSIATPAHAENPVKTPPQSVSTTTCSIDQSRSVA